MPPLLGRLYWLPVVIPKVMEEIRPIAREGTSTAADVEWAFPAKAIGAFLHVVGREVIFEPGL